jgi:hypothetical protein
MQPQQQQLLGYEQLHVFPDGAAACSSIAAFTPPPTPAAAASASIQGTAAMAAGSSWKYHPAPAIAPAAILPVQSAATLADPDQYLKELLQVQLTYQQQQQQHQEQQLLAPLATSRTSSGSCLTPLSYLGDNNGVQVWESALDTLLPSSRPHPQSHYPAHQQNRNSRGLRSATWGSDRFTSSHLTTLAELTEDIGGCEAGGGDGSECGLHPLQPRVISHRSAGRKGLPTKGATWGAGMFASGRRRGQVSGVAYEPNTSSSGGNSRRSSCTGPSHDPLVSRSSSVTSSSSNHRRGGGASLNRAASGTAQGGSSQAASAGASGRRSAGKGESVQQQQQRGRVEPPRWAGEFWHPLAEALRTGQLANGGTGVFISRSMQEALKPNQESTPAATAGAEGSSRSTG